MQLEVNQQNLYLFLPGKVANVAAIIADHDHCTMLEAMRRFYASPVYKALEQEDTKLWHLGAVALWEIKFIDDNAADQDIRDAQKLEAETILSNIKKGAIDYYRSKGCLVE